MNFLKKTTCAIALGIAMTGVVSCGSASYYSAGVGVGSQQYINPPWAPPYVSGVRYYYLPDIEAYYDLSNQDFVYLDNGQWLFSRTLPSIYSWYDLYDGFSVALNFNVYQPWMHNQYYVSHYPRYYYRNKYSDGERDRIRGFNENDAKPFYWTQPDRNRVAEMRSNNGNTRPNTNRPEANRPPATRPPQRTGYYGKQIGTPVKVQPQMRAPRNEGRRNEGQRPANNSRGSSSRGKN